MNTAQDTAPAALPPLAAALRRFAGIPPEQVRLTTAEAAAMLGLCAKTLEGWRVVGRGLAFYKEARTVTYRLSDLMDFMESSRFVSTRQAKTARQLGRGHHMTRQKIPRVEASK